MYAAVHAVSSAQAAISSITSPVQILRCFANTLVKFVRVAMASLHKIFRISREIGGLCSRLSLLQTRCPPLQTSVLQPRYCAKCG